LKAFSAFNVFAQGRHAGRRAARHAARVGQGTTFKNGVLWGREVWSQRLETLLSQHVAAGTTITSRDLEQLGNAEKELSQGGIQRQYAL